MEKTGKIYKREFETFSARGGSASFGGEFRIFQPKADLRLRRMRLWSTPLAENLFRISNFLFCASDF